MVGKKSNGRMVKSVGEAPAYERFHEISHAEHREVRDILLAQFDAFDKRDLKRAAALHGELCVHLGPHFRYEEETLHPLLEPIVGKAQVEHLNREHDRVIVDTIYLAKLTGKERLGVSEARWGKRLVQQILPHVSDCDGLAIMVEIMPEAEVKSIFAAREAALKDNISLLEWASTIRPRSFLSSPR